MSAEALAQILGGETLVLADVGASYFLPDTWYCLLPLSSVRVVLFDPIGKNLGYAAELDPERVTAISCALSRSGGISEFFLANTDSGSSLYPPHPWPGRPPLNDEYFFPLTVTDIETQTMASALDNHGIDEVHAIKLDTQGSELDILRGLDVARRSNLLLVEMEVTLDTYPAMLGAAQLPEVIDYFEANGFRYVNTRINPKALEWSGCVGPRFASTIAIQHECDVLFIRDLINAPPAGEDELLRTLRRQLTLLCAYYLHGEAIETARLAAERTPSLKVHLAALEGEIGEFAAYQSVRLKKGAWSLWHRNH